MTSNTTRLTPSEDAEAQGLYHTFGVIENLLSSSKADLAASSILKTDLLPYLIQSLVPPKDKTSAPSESNRFYAAELLAILLSSESQGTNARSLFLEKKGLDVCLQVLSGYRKRDPRGTEEVEFMENVFDLVCQCLGTEVGKKAFRGDEGVELMVILMKWVEGGTLFVLPADFFVGKKRWPGQDRSRSWISQCRLKEKEQRLARFLSMLWV